WPAPVEDAFEELRRLLSDLPRVTLRAAMGSPGVPIECLRAGGAGLRWDPESAGNKDRSVAVPRGAIWFPLRRPEDREQPYWRPCPSIVARNADVMSWIDEVLAGVTPGRTAYPPEIQLGKWTGDSRSLRLTKVLPFRAAAVQAKAGESSDEFA